MDLTPSSTQAHPRFDGSFAVPESLLAGVEDELARLVHESYTPDPRDANRAPAQRWRDKRSTLAHVAVVVCLGAAAIGAWRETGRETGRETWHETWRTTAHAAAPPRIETSATTAANGSGAALRERQQFERTARDLADLRQAVDRLTAGQGQLTLRMRKLEGEEPGAGAAPAEKADKRMPRRASAPPAPRVAARKPGPITPTRRQAERPVSTASPPSPPPGPAPQIQSAEALVAAAPPSRPPMPVPRP